MLKIIYVLPTLGQGGAESFVVDLARQVSLLGNEVVIYLTVGVNRGRGQKLYSKLKNDGIAVFGAELRNPYSIATIFSLSRLIKSFDPDLVHAHLFNAEWVAYFACFLLGVDKNRMVRTIHNTNVIGESNRFMTILLDKLYGLSIACSPRVMTSYRELYQGRFDTKLVSIPNGINLDLVQCSTVSNTVFESLVISDNAFVVTNIGAFRGSTLSQSQKAHDVVIKAFAKMCAQVQNAVLLLLGDGPLLESARKLAADLGVYNKVRFLGVVSDPEIYLSISSCFFLPSRYEGLPISLIEAACFGLPVVASEIPELLSLNDDYPWLFAAVDDVDAFSLLLVQLYESRLIDRNSYSKQFRMRFDIKTNASHHMAEYHALLSEAK